MIHHSLPESSLPSIEKSGLYTARDLEFKKLIPKHTAFCPFGGHGKHNIFFGFSAANNPWMSLPYFVRDRGAYATIFIALSQILEEKPELLRGLWSGHHWARLKGAAGKGPAVMLGTTRYQEEYVRKKISPQKFEYIRNLYFLREREKIPLKFSYDMSSEIATGEELIPFFVFSLIERLRYIGGSLREIILDNPEKNENLINQLMEHLFSAYAFEMYLPISFQLSDENKKYVKILTEKKRNGMAASMLKAAENGDIKTLESNFKIGYPIMGHVYEDYPENEKKIVLLPHHVTRENRGSVVKWLKQQSSLFPLPRKKDLFGLIEINLDSELVTDEDKSDLEKILKNIKQYIPNLLPQSKQSIAINQQYKNVLISVSIYLEKSNIDNLQKIKTSLAALENVSKIPVKSPEPSFCIIV